MIELIRNALPVGPTGSELVGHIFFDLAVSKVSTQDELDDVMHDFAQYAIDEVWPPGWPTVSDLVLVLRN
jgi:hypothetical protein